MRIPIEMGVSAVALALAGVLTPVAAAAQDGETSTVTEVVVTGSYIRRSSADSSSPIETVGSEQITARGQTNLGDVIQRLPYNAGSENYSTTTQAASVGTANVNLRNLGLNSTLVLLNGRRQVLSPDLDTDGSQFVDLNTFVPTIMVDRIEVLKDGASALYGTDAVAGVVNFITRKRFEGLRLEAQAQRYPDGGRENSIAAMFGAQGDRGSLVMGVSFTTINDIANYKKPYVLGTGFSSSGWPGAFTPVVSATNPTVDTARLAGYAASGGLRDLDCATIPGGVPLNPNTCATDFVGFFSLIPEQKRVQSYAVYTHDFSDDISGFAEFGVSRSETVRGQSASLTFLLTPIIIPTNNPGLLNDAARRGIPIGPVRFTGKPIGGTPQENYRNSPGANAESFNNREVWRGSVGFDAKLPWQDWSANGAVTYSRIMTERIGFDTVGDRVKAALAGLGGVGCDRFAGTPGVGPCQFLNLYGSAYSAQPGSPLYNSPELWDWLQPNNYNDYKQQLYVADFVATGKVIDLPAGPLSVAVGGQLRRDTIQVDLDDLINSGSLTFSAQSPDFKAARNVKAVFAEVAVPIAAEDSPIGALDLSAAIRYEDYGSVDTIDPKLALLWKPFDAWSFRASYGTSFRVANLIQALGVSGGLPNIVDPVTGRVGFVTSRLLGNPDLKPENAKTYNVGFSYRGREGWLDGVSVDVDYWRFNYQDLIVKQNEQALVNADAACGGCMPDSVIRSNGAVVQVRATYVNASSLKTDGVDFALGYAWDAGAWGDFNATLAGTYVNKYVVQTTPAAPKISAVDNRNATNFARAIPDLRFTAGITWSLGDWQAFAGVNYVDDYGNDFFLDPARAPTVPVLVSNPRHIASQTTVDLSLTYEMPDSVALAGGTRLSAGVNNLFNEDPPIVQDYGGFDQTTHDPRGRILWVRVSRDF